MIAIADLAQKLDELSPEATGFALSILGVISLSIVIATTLLAPAGESQRPALTCFCQDGDQCAPALSPRALLKASPNL